MNVYKCLVGKVEKKGVEFRVDLKQKNVFCDGKFIMKGGVYDGDIGVPVMDTEDALTLIEDLYQSFYLSYPSERNARRRKRYFIPLDGNEMSIAEMSIGEERELAQAKLEMTVLGLIMNGSLVWDDSWGSWFWQSKKNRNLILLKEWFN